MICFLREWDDHVCIYICIELCILRTFLVQPLSLNHIPHTTSGLHLSLWIWLRVKHLSLTLSLSFYGWWWIASIVIETRYVRLLLRWGIRLNYSIIATQYIAKGKERSHGGWHHSRNDPAACRAQWLYSLHVGGKAPPPHHLSLWI